LFKSIATVTTINNAIGIATSRVGIESTIINDKFIPLVKKTKKPQQQNSLFAWSLE
jgi:hypothetical protein